MVTARLPGPVLLCLAARLDGPDHPPYLCQRPEGHGGCHRVSEPDLFVWEWPNTAATSQVPPDQSDADHWQDRYETLRRATAAQAANESALLARVQALIEQNEGLYAAVQMGATDRRTLIHAGDNLAESVTRWANHDGKDGEWPAGLDAARVRHWRELTADQHPASGA